MSDTKRAMHAMVGVMASILVAVAVIPSGPAQGETRHGGRQAYGYAPQYVIAESEWGHGTIRGAVRPGRHGWQVRLPRGTWIDCVRSCSETLRKQTVDFWESNGPTAPGGGPGYFKWNFWF